MRFKYGRENTGVWSGEWSGVVDGCHPQNPSLDGQFERSFQGGLPGSFACFMSAYEDNDFKNLQVHFARHSNQLLASAGNDSKLCLWSINLEASSDYGHTNGHTSSSINRSHRSNSTNHALQCEPIFSTCCQENFNWLASGSAGNVNFLLVAGNSIFPSVYNFT